MGGNWLQLVGGSRWEWEGVDGSGWEWVGVDGWEWVGVDGWEWVGVGVKVIATRKRLPH